MNLHFYISRFNTLMTFAFLNRVEKPYSRRPEANGNDMGAAVDVGS